MNRKYSIMYVIYRILKCLVRSYLFVTTFIILFTLFKVDFELTPSIDNLIEMESKFLDYISQITINYSRE